MSNPVVLYQKGKTISFIAKKFNVSKQRILQILQKEGVHKRIQENTKASPLKSEIYLSKKLKSMGYNVKFMPHHHPFDLLVNGQIRVEVKRRRTTTKVKAKSYKKDFTYMYRVNHIANKKFDVMVVIVGERKKKHYIFTKDHLKNKSYLKIIANPKNKSLYEKRNKEAWHLLETSRATEMMGDDVK